MAPQKEPNNRVTLAVLGVKLDSLTEGFKEFRGEFTKHLDDYKAVRTEVDRLVQTEKSRVWYLRTIWAAIIASTVGWIWQK